MRTFSRFQEPDVEIWEAHSWLCGSRTHSFLSLYILEENGVHIINQNSYRYS